MSENRIDLMPVRDLIGKNFYIPEYQRGYRWTKTQAKDLIGDLHDFFKDLKDNKNEKHNGQFYCLQPLVVRKMSDKEKEKRNLSCKEEWFEVIDGQQRLITLSLLLLFFESKGYFCAEDVLKGNFNFSFARNPEINIEKIVKEERNETIDFHHLNEIWKLIKSDEERRKLNIDILRLLTQNLEISEDNDEEEIQRRKNNINDVRFIWYEAVDENPIAVFTRLNVGKIPLTNSELIKALLLNKGNFSGAENRFRSRQFEIGSLWDNIEKKLQNDSFWYFLTSGEEQMSTRIDFIINLIVENDSLKLFMDSDGNFDKEKMDEELSSDRYRDFRYFYKFFQKRKPEKYLLMKQCWNEITKYMKIFEEWYNDNIFYHYVGFLISSNKKINDLVKMWVMATNKTDFTNKLKAEIKKRVESYVDFPYKEDGTNKRLAKPLLLFHNIQTAIDHNEALNKKFRRDTTYRFPFNLYKLEKWDVEHINSSTTNSETDNDTRLEWIANVILAANKEQLELIKKFLYMEEGNEKTNLFSQIQSFFTDREIWTDKQKNTIGNYVLLDRSTNRSYGNAIFSAKRRIIMQKDMGYELPFPGDKLKEWIENEKDMLNGDYSKVKRTSVFVPPCTKYVFLKYYSEVSGENNYWTLKDAEDYKISIKRTIEKLNEK